ncbi:MAG: hypothetical protein ACTSV7_13760 [Candidatus Baldrarchaeia archaeon]
MGKKDYSIVVFGIEVDFSNPYHMIILAGFMYLLFKYLGVI